jgi:ferrous iron transport protein B
MTSFSKILQTAAALRAEVGENYHDKVMEAIYTDASQIADRSASHDAKQARLTFDRVLDQALTHPVWGFVVMGLMFFIVFWITITGANVPSQLLADLLLDKVYHLLHSLASALFAPAWLSGLLIDGVYLATAWVTSVMLPPMAIFFPLFTLLEDFGYLPRVAFNLDRLFAKAGAHGKQALSMMMGYGCNAAGVVATRIIDSPRERLIAIITNNFSICNGRWPTLILMGTIFLGVLVPPALASLVAALSVVAIATLGIVVTLLVSWGLSKTLLKGETSVYSLELPPYRPPQILKTLYTSMIDRTMIVLWRAVVMAAPAGGIIWLASNIHLGETSVAIPANEIIIPTIIMLTLTLGKNIAGAQAGVMLSLEDAQVRTVLTQVGGWTVLTAVNLMLFSLLHNPCSTTILTIWNETRNAKWTAVATLLPLALAFLVTFSTATLVHLLGAG